MAKEKLGLFSESDAKNIAKVVNSIIRNGGKKNQRHRKRVTGGGTGSSCPTELPDIISAEDADYVQVIRMVDGQPTCVLAELQAVVCYSTSPPSTSTSGSPVGSPSGSLPSGSLPSNSFSDCLSEWGSDCLPNSPGSSVTSLNPSASPGDP